MKIYRFVIVLVLALLLVPGCRLSGQSNADALRQECQPLVDNLILAYNAGDFASFAACTGGRAGALATAANFRAAHEQLGACTSIEFITVSESNNEIRAGYRARFSKMSDRLSFTVVFARSDNKLLVMDVVPN